MSTLGKRWAKIGPRQEKLGLSKNAALRLGGVGYLDSLSEDARAVLLNEAKRSYDKQKAGKATAKAARLERINAA